MQAVQAASVPVGPAPAEVKVAAVSAPAAAPTVEPEPQSLVQKALSAVLAPLLGSGPGEVPVAAPFMWALAAAARRQFEPSTDPLTAGNLLRTSADTTEDVGADATTFSALALPAGVEQQNLVVTGAVGTGASPSGVAVSGGKAYVTNATNGTMTVVNLADNAVLATVPVGASPTAVVVNTGTRAYVTNSTAGTVTVINTTNNSVVKTITVGANPAGLASLPPVTGCSSPTPARAPSPRSTPPPTW